MSPLQILAALAVAGVALVYALGPGYRAGRIYGRRFSHEPTWWSSRPAIGLVTLALGAVCLWATWQSADLILALPLVVFGPTLAVIDAAVHRLPNAINAAFAASTLTAVLLAWALDGDGLRVMRALFAAGFIGVLFVLTTFVRGGFGMGDVKLAPSAFGLAAAVGLTQLGVMVVVTFFGAGLYALTLVATRRAHLTTPIALGPWIILGLTAAFVAA